MNSQEVTTKYDEYSQSAAAEVEPISELPVEEVPKVEDAFSKKFAALSRKEKQVHQAERAGKDRIAKLEAQYSEKLAALEARMAALDAKPAAPAQQPLEYRLKQNPLKALQELGLGYDKITELALNDGKLTPEMQMELWKQDLEQKQGSELDKIRRELQEREQNQQSAREQEVLNNFKLSINNFIDDNADTYELIKSTGQSDLVFRVIDEHFQSSGKVLSTKEASDHVEAHLESEARKLLSLKKLAAQKVAPALQPKVKVSSPTLSNSSTQALSTPSKRFLSNDESLAEAAKLLRWEE